MNRIKRAFLTVLKHTLNPLTLRAARAGRGPFALVRHVGRSTGRVYETPLILAPTTDGLVAELTYGPQVAWYRNVVAAGVCDVIVGGREHHVVGIGPLEADVGRAAFPAPARAVLRLLRRNEFRLLRTSAVLRGTEHGA